MSNTWYEKSIAKIGKNTLDLDSLIAPTIVLIESGEYTFSQAHEFFDDVPAAARMGEVALANWTFGVSGESWVDADDPTFVTPAVAQAIAMIVYDDTGVEATSELLFYIDTSNDLPLNTESARDVDVAFNANGIARL